MIPFGFMPRSMFDMDFWARPRSLGFGPSTLDMFDPFDDLDLTMGRNFRWLNRPDFMRPSSLFSSPLRPAIPEKYRVTLDATGFSPNSIKTEIAGNRVNVSAKEEDRIDSNNYSIRELRKSYDFPAEAEIDKLASFVTSNGQLVLEAPLRGGSFGQSSGFGADLDANLPKINDDGKAVSVSMSLPQNVDPAKVSVTCKDRDLIIKAEDRVEKPDGMSQYSYYKRTTLPENTDFNAIKCTLDKNQLAITAPLLQDFKSQSRSIPIQNARTF